MWREKKGAIFDMDGTLMDSLWMWRQIDIDYLARFGHPLPPTLQADLGGKSIYETAVYMKERFQIPDSVEQMQADWNDMALEYYRTKVPLKPGARRLLQKMKEHGLLLGIATSNSYELAHAALEANGVQDLFDTVRTSREVPRGKPAPDIYLSVAQEWSIAPEELLVFEDIPDGIVAGQRAGMEVIAVDDAFASQTGQAERVRDLAKVIIQDFTELL